MNLKLKIKEFKKQGYTIFNNYIDNNKINEWRNLLDPQFQKIINTNPDATRLTITPILKNLILLKLSKEHLLKKLMLDFSEKVMGPYVQLDSFEVTGYPPKNKSLKGEVHRWHRDQFNVIESWIKHPTMKEQSPKIYTPPLACNCLTYLQDMDKDSGELRIIKESHVNYISIDKTNEDKPQKNETLIKLNAGDMVFTHNEILHSGTINTSKFNRYFLSVYLCKIGFPHRDTFELPVINEIINEAKVNNDLRILRFFGMDNKFMQREEKYWEIMIDKERKLKNN